MTNEVRESFEFVTSGDGRSVLYDYYDGSRAASTQNDERVTEMINGLLVSQPTVKKEPEIIDLQEYARSD